MLFVVSLLFCIHAMGIQVSKSFFGAVVFALPTLALLYENFTNDRLRACLAVIIA
jgi:hypothetical protein